MTKIYSAQILRSLKESGPDCLAQQCLLASTVLSYNCQGLVTKNFANLNAKQRASSSGCPPLPVLGLKRAGPVSTTHYHGAPVVLQSIWPTYQNTEGTYGYCCHLLDLQTHWEHQIYRIAHNIQGGVFSLTVEAVGFQFPWQRRYRISVVCSQIVFFSLVAFRQSFSTISTTKMVLWIQIMKYRLFLQGIS